MDIVCQFCKKPIIKPLLEHIQSEDIFYDMYFCSDCRIGMTVPMPTQEMLSQLYGTGAYRGPSGEKFGRIIEMMIYFLKLLRKRRIHKYIRQGIILDVGCGRGDFLDIMKKVGWNVYGVEFNKETASYAAAQYGIDVVSGEPSSWEFPEDSFDVIAIVHVLEHLHNPDEMLDACARLLKKGGLLIVTVPNLMSPQALFGESKWFHLDIPHHLFHFTEEGLVALLTKRSLSIKRIRHFDFEQNLFGWLQTFLNKSGIKENCLYNLLKKPVIRKREKAPYVFKDVLLTYALLPLYIPVSVALSVYESFVCKKGGTVEITAIKL